MKLAEIVDMNFNYIGQIERGEANVTIKTMIVLANALDIELKTLFDFTFWVGRKVGWAYLPNKYK